MLKQLIILFFITVSASSCATFYKKYEKFNNYVESGQLKKADAVLSKDEKLETGKNRLLYYLNLGAVNSAMGEYDTSNYYFEKAYIFTEDFTKDPAKIALSFVTNPQMRAYDAEDHEAVLINYYKAINYLMTGQRQKALVECRRMNLRLQRLSDKYGKENRYQKDAFIHNVMGMVYDANKDYNNAFIAYRNAYNIYEDEYKKHFGFSAPGQLKKDILRTAYLTGLFDELNRYEKEFDLRFNEKTITEESLVFLYHSGLGPVKEEWSINFVVNRGEGGVVAFHNSEYGLDFAFPIGDSREDADNLSDVEFVRVAFPKYRERPILYNSAKINVNNESYSLDLAQDVNAIAFKTLKDRMVYEFGKALLRVALKKAAEYRLRKENEGIGALVGALSALAEKADTRNWQTIPHSIYYKRIPMNLGKQTLSFIELPSCASAGSRINELTFDIKDGETAFHFFNSFDIANCR